MPEDLSILDSMLELQDVPEYDSFNITKIMPWSKYTKDSSNRVMQKNWNTTLFPLYGGPVYEDVRKQEIKDEVMIESKLSNPLGDYIK